MLGGGLNGCDICLVECWRGRKRLCWSIYVYGECGGVCQWYSVCDGVVSVSIHLGGEDGMGLKAWVVHICGMVYAKDLLFSPRAPVRLSIRVKHGLGDQDSHVL